MKVFRIEFHHGDDDMRLGPYSLLYFSHECWNGRPSPKDDPIDEFGNPLSIYVQHSSRFGFASREKLFSWFDVDDRRKIRAADVEFCIAVYRLDKNDVIQTSKQLIFLWQNAHLVSRHRVTKRMERLDIVVD